MKFRPCIDIHNGSVVQIVGSSLNDSTDSAQSNFRSEKDSVYYAELYKENDLSGGHVIILNGKDSQYYEKSRNQALNALKAYPDGLQLGGGVNADNALEYIDAGASHVIVTSYVFKDGKVNYDNLNRLINAVGKEHIVLDLSCKKKDDKYYIATDRWQVVSSTELDTDILCKLANCCDEFLVHAVDSEGKKSGIDETIVSILKESPIPVTYAGGISSYDDISKLKALGNEKIDFTIGSSLDIFGGNLVLSEVLNRCTQ